MTDAIIYRLCEKNLWDAATRAGVFCGGTDDVRDGFIHFSTADQLVETARRHYAGVDPLMLIAVDAAALGPSLKWESSRGGALFPHLYADLPMRAVISTARLARNAAGEHVFAPEFLT